MTKWGWFGKQVASGWQMSGITRFETGTPLTVTAGSDRNLDGNANDRVNLVGNPVISGDRSRDEELQRYFDTSAFALPGLGTVGTAGRSLFNGPGAQTWNLSAFKNFTPFEHHRLQFRAEFFSAFNHPNFGNPNTASNNSNFGRILSAGGARVVQFGLKYMF